MENQEINCLHCVVEDDLDGMLVKDGLIEHTVVYLWLTMLTPRVTAKAANAGVAMYTPTMSDMIRQLV